MLEGWSERGRGRSVFGRGGNEPFSRRAATNSSNGRIGMRAGSRSLVLFGAAAAAVLVAGCVPAIVGGGVFVVGVTSAILFSGCDEPASVQVWDHTSSYPVCDATVTAVSESGSTTTFSPCYSAYLGAGTWKVTASKPGLANATGTITVALDHKCSQPIFHSLDLTLGSDGSAVPAPPPVAPGAPRSPSPAASSPATSPPAAPPPATSSPAAAPALAPAPATSSTVPAAAFPSAPPAAPVEVPAPPSR